MTTVFIAFSSFFIVFPGFSGGKEAELYLLDLFRPHLPLSAQQHIEEELSADHSGELALPDQSGAQIKVNCSHKAGGKARKLYKLP